MFRNLLSAAILLGIASTPAAARAATLTVASVDSRGQLKAEVVVPTTTGARNAVVTEDGFAYLTDSPGGKLLIVPPASHR